MADPIATPVGTSAEGPEVAEILARAPSSSFASSVCRMVSRLRPPEAPRVTGGDAIFTAAAPTAATLGPTGVPVRRLVRLGITADVP